MDHFNLMNQLLQVTVNQNATYLYLASGQRPLVKTGDGWRWLDAKALDSNDTLGLVESIIPEDREQPFEQMGIVDFELDFGALARFRILVIRLCGEKAILAKRILPGG